ncbi:MAG: winged helix-turn-helix transcriptional regulator [Promethearchaeota archaeon]
MAQCILTLPQFMVVTSFSLQGPPDDLPVFPEGSSIYVENENIAIQVIGGEYVPMYSFWDPSQTETKYSVKFIKLFEIIDQNQDGNYSEHDTLVPESVQALPDMSWIFSEIETAGDGTTHFNITSQGAAFTIQFANHFGTDASLKFDIIIENYDFVSNNEDVMLVLGFNLLVGESEEELTQSGNQINFGENAYFEAKSTATASGETINVGVTKGTDEGEESLAYVSYERFSGTLVHDPKIGIDTSIIPPVIDSIFFIIIPIVCVILLSGIVMSKEKYRDFLINRVIHLNTAPHRLDIEEVLENQIRSQIIDEIIEDPGIHYNEILRIIGTSPSNLAWHLDILESYKVIKKQRIGHYLIYYPYFQENPFSDMNPNIIKSKTTLEVLKTINEYPGIYMSRISQILKLNRNTIKYHIEKLLEAKLIIKRKQGRKFLLFESKEIKY